MMKRDLVAVAVVAALVSACGGDALGGARTYYESLDLGSPRSAVETFTGAFGRNDFMTVWLAFDTVAQDELQRDFDLLHYDRVFDAAAAPDYHTWLEGEFLNLVRWDSHDPWYIFDRLMMLADEHDAFLIDLSGPVSIVDVSDTTGGYTKVTAEVDGIEGEVTFLVTQSRTERWKVAQVILPNGDTTLVPWAVPASGT
jgi:hypothetical protein